MTALKKAKTVSAPMSGDLEEIRIEYDFAEDGGAVGALDVLTASGALLIESVHTTVLTTCTSGGSATLKMGVETADDDRFLTTTQGAVANLVAGASFLPVVVEGTPNVIALPYVLPDGGKIVQTIGTAALTAGKVQYVIRYRRV